MPSPRPALSRRSWSGVASGGLLLRQDVLDSTTCDEADALAFNQWRVTEEHRPLGEIMQVRKIYSTSAKVRRRLNHQSQAEPTSPDLVVH